MRKLPLVLLALLSLPSAASAQWTQGVGVPSGSGGLSGFVTCTSGICTFTGADGSTQLVVGNVNGSVDYLQILGAISGGGATMNCTSATDTNVACNFTGKGNGATTFNNAHGNLGAFVDPGATVSTNGGVQLTPSTSSGPTKVGNATYGVNLDGGTAQIYQVGGQPLYTDFPGFIVGNWYLPLQMTIISAGAAPGANSIRLFPAYIKQKVTISSLGMRVQTISAAGNVQAAIYANNAATGRPTGAVLVSTASMSTGTAASVNAAVSIQLNPGLYWFASNCDNGTAAFESVSTVSMWAAYAIGSPNQASILGNSGSGLSGLNTAQTFGTWPSLTSASFTESIGVSTIPIIQFQVGSVP